MYNTGVRRFPICWIKHFTTDKPLWKLQKLSGFFVLWIYVFKHISVNKKAVILVEFSYRNFGETKMASATVVNIQRNSVNEPWGMKIAGGRDFRMQLQVKKVSCSLSLSISHLYLSASSFGCNIRPSCFANDMPYHHTCITGVHERYLVS